MRPGIAQRILLDQSCPQPCWRAIQPGQTTIGQARTLLIAGAPLIQHVNSSPNSDIPGPEPHVCWSINVIPNWQGCAARDIIADGPVNRIEIRIPIQANFTLGEAILMFGRPKAAVVCPLSGLPNAALYFDNNVEVTVLMYRRGEDLSPGMAR